MPEPRAVHHFGPDPSCVGGMGSVLRVLAENRIGGEQVTLHPTWRPDSQLATATLTARAARTIATLPADSVVHIHLSERGSFLREGLLLAQARRCGLGTVATIHGADFLPFAERRPRLALGVLRRADRVTCLDREIRALLAAELGAGAGAGGADETSEVVLFAGEISSRKGADVLAAAWSRVAAARPAARCLMVGPPSDVAVPALERLDVRPPVDAAGMRSLLREARVVALPSRAEGMPMFLTEALAAGRPFVSTPVGGIPELAAAGGTLVPVGDPEPLAKALIELLSSPEHARARGEEGRGFCAATRSAAVIDRRLREIYAAASAARA
jgi:hypothetical protein